MEFWRDAVPVLDPRNRRRSGGSRRPIAWHQGPRRRDDRIDHLHRHPDDHPDPGADQEVAGGETGAAGGVRGEWRMEEATDAPIIYPPLAIRYATPAAWSACRQKH